MVSYGPDIQSLNYTHMYDFIDYRNTIESEPCRTKNTVYDYIFKRKDMSQFKKIVEKAMMEGYLNDLQFNSTIFIPLDNNISKDFVNQIDIGLAREIVKSSIINTIVDKKLLTSSPVSYYYTKNPIMKLYYTFLRNVSTLNNCCKVIEYDIKCNNGIIHLIDCLIMPSEEHFMN